MCLFVLYVLLNRFGEFKCGHNWKDDKWDAYVAMNKNISAELNVTYLNMRAVYCSQLPVDWGQYSGYFTRDGEHYNRRGAEVLRKAFTDSLFKIYSLNATL